MRALVRSAVNETDSAVVFHGHWHQQNRSGSMSAAKLSGWQPTEAPRARPSCRSATSEPDTWTRSSARTEPDPAGASPSNTFKGSGPHFDAL